MAFVNTTVVFATPLLFAAIAGLIAERAGVLNIALEGFMLAGAFVAAWIAGGHGSMALAIFGVAVAGSALGLLYALIVVLMRADQVAVGIAFNIFMLGATDYGYSLVTQSGGQQTLQTSAMSSIAVPGLAHLPVVGAVFNQPWLTFVAYALAPIAYVVLFRTGLGIRIRACGEYAVGARSAGINVGRWRVCVVAVSCMIAALGGSYLVLGDAHGFIDNMSSGKGYIALAVIILARWSPVGAIAAAALFGAAQALNIQAQGGSILGVRIPGQFVQTLPYLVTILAVTIVGRRVRPPEEDGKPLAAA